MLSDCVVIDCTDQLGWLCGRVLADLGADVIKVEAPETDRNHPDWRAFNVNKRLCVLDLKSPSGDENLEQLIAGADILVTCSQVSEPLFDYSRLSQENPGLILVRITPFGTSGPRSNWKASDIELMAAGGAMSLAGEPGSTPVRITVPQSYSWTGVQAAVGALTALNGRSVSNKGQEVRVSAQASIIPALAFAPMYWDMLGQVPTRAGSFAMGRSVTGAKLRAFWPCKDGYLNFIIYGGPAGKRTNKQLVDWMRTSGAELGVLAEIDWDTFTQVKATQEEIDAMEAPIADFFMTLTKQEFLMEGSRREILGYPVFNVADISEDPQLQERKFWSEKQTEQGEAQKHCGVFYLINGERPEIRFDGTTDESLDILKQINERSVKEIACQHITSNEQHFSIPRALNGVKVLEFGGYAAGPQIGKILANFGATVLHVEAPTRPDGFRLEYPPFKDGKPGLNRGGCFAIFNDSKDSITLDVKKPGGIDLALKLAAWSDIVIENMRPGVMSRIGLGYDTLSKHNPALVMLSTCNMGQTGPRAMTPGFGSQLSALSGFCGLTGESDGPPMLLYGPYIDFIAANFGASAVLAALDKARQKGDGSHIDLSQYETGLQFMAGALFDYHVNGHIADRNMNSDPVACPHGAYPCLNNEWVAFSCWSNEEFQRLTAIMNNVDLSSDVRFVSVEKRHENEADLNDIIAQWTSRQTALSVTELLQDHGICAYPVNTVADVFTDPQLRELGTWRWRRHAEIGLLACNFPPFDLCETPGDIYNTAPLFGEGNDYVYRELIGLSDAEMEKYLKDGVIGTG